MKSKQCICGEWIYDEMAQCLDCALKRFNIALVGTYKAAIEFNQAWKEAKT